MRLIDADELRRKMYYQCIYTDEEMKKGRAKWDSGLWIRYKVFEDTLAITPTVDAVDVVRCKDCFYCRKYNEIWQLPKRDVLLCIRLYGGDGEEVSAEDYCSFAERREDETN